MNVLKAWLLALALASASAQAGDRLSVDAAGESVMTMRVDGELTIGTDGQVLEYKLRTSVDQRLQDMLAKAIPAWRMVPLQQGGRPIVAKTPMRIILAATEIAGGYEVRIDNVVFAPLTKEDHDAAAAALRAAADAGETIAAVGEPATAPVLITARKMQPPPGYPVGLMRAGVEGIVLLNLRINPDGTVAEAFAAQSSLLNVKGRSVTLDKARGLLEKESMRAARKWTFDVVASDPSVLEGDDMTVRIPVEYRLGIPGQKDDKSGFAGAWRYEFRGPNLPAPWLLGKSGQQIVGVSDLEGGEQVSGNSPFRLRDRGSLGKAL